MHTCFIAVNFSIHTAAGGGGGGGLEGGQFGGGSKKFSILIFPIYQLLFPLG